MSSDWFLEELGSIVTGKTPPQAIEEAYAVLGTPFLTPKDMDGRKWVTSTERYLSEAGANSVKKSLIPAGSISVSCIGTVGKVVMVPVSTVTNQQINSIIPDKTKCNPEYLYYLLSTMQQELQGIAGGTVMPILNKGHFSKIQVRLPSINYQLAAAKILSGFDDKIQLNHQINQTLEQMAQAIFKSWFVDFEPVKAKIAALEAGGSEDDALLAAMQAIAGNALFASNAADADAATQLARLQAEHPEQYATLRATAELFPSAMQESELGEIPEGWGCTTLENLCTTITKGTTPKKSELAAATDDAVVHFIKVKDITGTGEIIREGLEEIPDSISRKSLKRSILKNGDLLFSIAGTIGRVAVVDATLEDSNTNQAVGIIRLSEQEKHLALVWQTLLSDRVQNEIRSKVVQGVQANASLKNLRDIQVIRPCDKLLNTASSHLSALLKEISSNHAQSRNLTELRDTLLPKLLSGELSISAATDQITQAEEAIDVQS